MIGPLHKNQELCKSLLRNLDAAAALEILPSKAHQHGTGLFAKEGIPEGAEVFRSTPLVTCIEDEMQSIICDFCFTSSANKINADGHFTIEGDVLPKINRCTKCRVCSYCSKVRPPIYHV